MEFVMNEELTKLIEAFSKRQYSAKDHDSLDDEFFETCLNIISKDYNHSLLKNDNGELSTNYPSKIIVLGSEKYDSNSANSRSCDDYSSKLRENIFRAKNARCRARFPLPVLLFEGKTVCRSGTLSGGPEIYGRSGYDYLFSGGDNQEKENVESMAEMADRINKLNMNSSSKESPQQSLDESKPVGCSCNCDKDNVDNNDHQPNTANCECSTNNHLSQNINQAIVANNGSDQTVHIDRETLEEIAVLKTKTEWQLFSKVRSQDIRLLKWLNVQYIIDLMVEKKKVKFGINVTSSEKVDKENRYNEFSIVALPYPGCEFFKKFKDHNYCAENLVFEWSQSFCDAELDIPHDNISSHVRVDWTNYKKWDLIKLTKNYMKLILGYLAEGRSGLLIHCISGWDRTPLFISLIRLSLWADGKIHTSLSPAEILYLVIAYDWYFFGHNLVDRLCKGEEIFFFLFFILKHLSSEQFSIQYIKARSYSVHRNESDSNIDGVLLESSLEAGSNSSLNSIGSTTSNRSSLDGTGPVHFSLPSNDNTHSYPFNRPTSGSITMPNMERLSSVSSDFEIPMTSAAQQRLETSTDTLIADDSPAPSCHNNTGAIPVPVPHSNSQEHNENSYCGSWQVITGTGSVSGSAHLSISSAYADSGSSDGSYATRTRRPSTPRTRRDKLANVRDLFYKLYRSTIGFKPSDPSSFSNIIEQVAGKIGIKSSKNVPV